MEPLYLSPRGEVESHIRAIRVKPYPRSGVEKDTPDLSPQAGREEKRAWACVAAHYDADAGLLSARVTVATSSRRIWVCGSVRRLRRAACRSREHRPPGHRRSEQRFAAAIRRG
jgi:hypothetical protein